MRPILAVDDVVRAMEREAIYQVEAVEQVGDSNGRRHVSELYSFPGLLSPCSPPPLSLLIHLPHLLSSFPPA